MIISVVFIKFLFNSIYQLEKNVNLLIVLKVIPPKLLLKSSDSQRHSQTQGTTHRHSHPKSNYKNTATHILILQTKLNGQHQQGCQKNQPPRIPAGNTRNGAGMGEDFAPPDNGDGDFKYPHIKWGGGGDHYPHTRGYRL